ncbi:MAG: isocitrate lyase/phosphoenolpyruvate mutase family protein, partial [Bryobacteraceae bacterium]
LRDLLASRALIAGVGARDALDARLIENAGFDFVWSSSFCVSVAHCVPDASILSMTQFLETARAINEAIEIPIVFDADTGYGGEANTAYAARLLEEADMGAICIEDKVFPKQSSLLPGGAHPLVSTGDFSRKIAAAKSAGNNGGMVVIARTEALIAGLGVDEALRRAEAYEKAGADLILFHSKSKTPDEIVECVKRWSGKAPVTLVPTNYPDLDEPAMEALGKIKMVIYGNQTVRAAVQAVEDVLREIRHSRGARTVDGRIASVNHVFSLQGEKMAAKS